MKAKTQMVLILTVLSGWFIPANSQTLQTSPLEGSWVLDSITVVQTENGKPVTPDLNTLRKDPNLGIWDELIFEGGNLTAATPDFTGNAPVSVSGDRIEYAGAPSVLTYTWKTDRGKLYLTRECAEISLNKPDDIRYNISLVYLKKN
jgi:hypothetical protein